MAERIDNIGFNDYKLIQDADGFCYGIDAVLLAHFSLCNHNETVLDLCCGNGAVSLIIDAKYNPKEIVGLELQGEQVDLAKRSAELNGLAARMNFICGDAIDIEEHVKAEGFDVVVCNPPYFEKERGICCDEKGKNLARHESSAGISDFIRAGAYALKKGGRMNIIHRPSRLVDIICKARELKMEPKLMQFVSPHPQDSPNMVLVQLVKGGGKELKMLPEIAVRKENGEWSDLINSIYER